MGAILSDLKELLRDPVGVCHSRTSLSWDMTTRSAPPFEVSSHVESSVKRW